MPRKTILATAILSALSGGAVAQTEVVGAIAGALAAQRMASDAEAERLTGLANAKGVERRDGFCDRMQTRLTRDATRTTAYLNLVEAYKATCLQTPAR